MQTLHLVQRSSTFYPKSEDDFKLLRRMKVAHDSLHVDTIPLLMNILRGYRQSLKITHFQTLEERLEEKLREIWGEGLLTFDPTHITIQCSRSKLTRLNKTVDSLMTHYEKFDVVIEYKTRTSKTKLTCKMTKRSRKKREN